MKEKNLTVNDKVGFHARTASLFAKKAMQFSADVKVLFNQKEVNGKSMLSIMSLGVKQGMEVKVKAEGADEQQALDALAQLVENNFES
jgi:phosphocarrier protein HPr